MRASVDKELCIGCGVCEAECPEVFRIADDGLAEAIEGELTEEVLEKAQEAKEQCPVEAITIE
ncbi:MAG TPA: ferredoxin [Peptococcaceae bacterium]|nr:ferredoxin [Peptococcaceae bacterium]